MPSCLFELVYLKDPDKYSAVRQLGRFAFVDYVAFSLCYVLYLAVFLVAVFWMCKRVWNKYGKYSAFKGWYLNCEISRKSIGMANLYRDLGNFCKELSGNLPTMISPYIAGIKSDAATPTTLAEHERDWNTILSTIENAVDIVAFQDGHCDYEELLDYLTVNRELALRYGMKSWTNCESFDRDMPINFLPIKWEKMRLKLLAAAQAQVDKAITFEFSHFMSPNSMYASAHGLYDRYMEFISEL